jgi:hypothetical protein
MGDRGWTAKEEISKKKKKEKRKKETHQQRVSQRE